MDRFGLAVLEEFVQIGDLEDSLHCWWNSSESERHAAFPVSNRIWLSAWSPAESMNSTPSRLMVNVPTGWTRCARIRSRNAGAEATVAEPPRFTDRRSRQFSRRP